MKTDEVWIEDGVVVPESALLTVERDTGYGSVPGLEDEELADPAELERQVLLEEWGPILAIPIRRSRPVIRPNIDENNELDWGPFGTVDFARHRPACVSTFRLAHELQEELRDALSMLGIVGERLSIEDRAEVLRLIQVDHVDLDDFEDFNRWSYARWYLRASKLRRRIQGLRRAAHRKVQDDGDG